MNIDKILILIIGLFLGVIVTLGCIEYRSSTNKEKKMSNTNDVIVLEMNNKQQKKVYNIEKRIIELEELVKMK